MVDRVLHQLAELNNPDIKTVVITHNLVDEDLQKPDIAVFDLVQIHNSQPLGFAANHNQAFQHCQTAWYAVLNPDLEFLYGDPFPALLAAGESDLKLGMLAPLLIQPETMRSEPNRGAVTPYEIIRRRLPRSIPPEEPAWLVGAFLLIRADVYSALHGFDARFRLYCEDVDLGLRVVRAGWAIRRVESAKVAHMTQRRSHRSLKYMGMHMLSLFRLWGKEISSRFEGQQKI